jgi:hypothetical protein
MSTPDQLAAPLAYLAAHEHGVHVPGVGALHDRADRVVQRQVVDVLGADGHDVGRLARGEAADLAAEPDVSGTGELQAGEAGRRLCQAWSAMRWNAFAS